MLHLRGLVLVVALALLTLAHARPARLGQNAERMKRGLPPAPPVRAYDASRTTAHLARRSTVPGEAGPAPEG
ncbi:hypothetical protein Q5752_004486 [Cryptotrichosporon argae]